MGSYGLAAVHLQKGIWMSPCDKHMLTILGYCNCRGGLFTLQSSGLGLGVGWVVQHQSGLGFLRGTQTSHDALAVLEFAIVE